MGKKKAIEGGEPGAFKRPRTRGNKDPDPTSEAHSHDSNEQVAASESNGVREESRQEEPLNEGESSQGAGRQDTELAFRSKMLEFMESCESRTQTCEGRKG